mmetsp:Transcript_28043/g.50526  ORF Transcript_28043/g.50526 Transcript_28043/m.50526 type:complete len:96 (-) Transcript_28043:8-295(-)
MVEKGIHTPDVKELTTKRIYIISVPSQIRSMCDFSCAPMHKPFWLYHRSPGRISLHSSVITMDLCPLPVYTWRKHGMQFNVPAPWVPDEAPSAYI